MSKEETEKILRQLNVLGELTKEYSDCKSVWMLITTLKSRLKYYGIEYNG